MPCAQNLAFNLEESVCDWPENIKGCEHLSIHNRHGTLILIISEVKLDGLRAMIINC